MQTSTVRQKTWKKSEAFWKHGKHKGLLQAKLMIDRQKIPKSKMDMYPSVREAFKAARKNKKQPPATE